MQYVVKGFDLFAVKDFKVICSLAALNKLVQIFLRIPTTYNAISAGVVTTPYITIFQHVTVVLLHTVQIGEII